MLPCTVARYTQGELVDRGSIRAEDASTSCLMPLGAAIAVGRQRRAASVRRALLRDGLAQKMKLTGAMVDEGEGDAVRMYRVTSRTTRRNAHHAAALRTAHCALVATRRQDGVKTLPREHRHLHVRECDRRGRVAEGDEPDDHVVRRQPFSGVNSRPRRATHPRSIRVSEPTPKVASGAWSARSIERATLARKSASTPCRK